MLETWDTLNRDISRVHEMCDDFVMFVPFPIVYAVCVGGEQSRDLSGSQIHVPEIS